MGFHQTNPVAQHFLRSIRHAAVLKAYAESEKADPSLWTFATGNKSEIEKLTHAFSVYVQPEKGTISQGLATALIDRQGRIFKIWRGNGWSPSEILHELATRSD